MKKKIAVKIGTSTLTEGTTSISRDKIENIVLQLKALQDEYDIILISSGAIAAARDFQKSTDDPRVITNKSALSAIGQPLLMQIYMEEFQKHDLQAAQCLVTHFDFEKQSSRKNTYRTMRDLLRHGYIPIINENDTVAVEEISVGDNDTLSALVADLMDVDTLIIASDIDGIFDSNPHKNPNAKLISDVSSVDDVRKYVDDVKSRLGTGGMASKINAMDICALKEIEVFIVNGQHPLFIKDTLSGKLKGTRFQQK